MSDEVENASAMNEKENVARCSDLHWNLNYFRHMRQYCDVIIKVQGQDFPCHRLVLASVSEFFHAMFGGRFKENKDPVIDLKDVDATSFESILLAVYTGQACKVTAHNINNLLHTSNFLRITSVEQSCVEFILRRLSWIGDYIDIIDLFSFVCNVNLTPLITSLGYHIVHNFSRYYNDETFMEMSFDVLRCFLDDYWNGDDDKLELGLPFASSEFDNFLLDLIIRWVHHAPEERRKHFKYLIEVVNFERISAEYITFLLKYFKNLFEVSNYEGICTTIDESIMKERDLILMSPFTYRYYLQDRRNRRLLEQKITKYFMADEDQSSDRSKDIMVTLPSLYPESCERELGLHIYLQYTTIDSSICALDSHSGRFSPKGFINTRVFSVKNEDPEDWFCSCEINAQHVCRERCTVVPQPADLMYCLETSISEDNISEDFGTVNLFHSYSSLDMSLPSSVLTPPPVTFSNNSNYNMCAVRRDIYFYVSQSACMEIRTDDKSNGGNCTQDLYHYVPELDEWFPQPKTRFKAHDACLTADDNLVYLIGGEREYDVFSKGVQALDYRTARWMTLPNCINDPHMKSIGSCLNGNIYLYSKPDYRYETYDAKAGKWRLLPNPDLRADFVYKMLPYQNKLWTFIECEDTTDDLDFLYVDTHEGFRPNHYKIAWYDPIWEEWRNSYLLINIIANDMEMLKETAGLCLMGVEIADVITFKAPSV